MSQLLLFSSGPAVADRACPACCTVKALSEFHRDNASVDGRVRCCKWCVAKRDADRYAREQPRLRAQAAGRYRENRAAIAARRAARRSANADEVNKRGREYARQNPDKVRLYNKRWRIKNAAYDNQRKRKWEEENPLSRKIQESRYRARVKAQRICRITMKQLAERISVFGDRCAYCRDEWQHIDHVKPIARGGPHCLANLRPACARCNLRKNDKDAKVWLAALPAATPLPLPEAA